jgi:two-component system sensor histidine kinase FlrB
VVVSDLLAELRQVVEPHMAQRDLQFTVDDQSATETMITDHQALCGAMINLLENAMQAAAPGGRIVLACRLQEKNIMLSVHDDGPGIDAALQERLFEPFFTTRAEGTGLGLAIVRGVIESMGGDVHIHSIPHEGTEFRVRLPRNTGEKV